MEKSETKNRQQNKGVGVQVTGSGLSIHALALSEKSWVDFKRIAKEKGDSEAFDAVEDGATRLFFHQGPMLSSDFEPDWKAGEIDEDEDQQNGEFLAMFDDETPEGAEGASAVVIQYQNLRGEWYYHAKTEGKGELSAFSREYYPVDVCVGEVELQEPIVSAILIGDIRAELKDESNIDISSVEVYAIELPGIG